MVKKDTSGSVGKAKTKKTNGKTDVSDDNVEVAVNDEGIKEEKKSKVEQKAGESKGDEKKPKTGEEKTGRVKEEKLKPEVKKETEVATEVKKESEIPIRKEAFDKTAIKGTNKFDNPKISVGKELIEKYTTIVSKKRLQTKESKISAVCALYRVLNYLKLLSKENRYYLAALFAKKVNVKGLKDLEQLKQQHDLDAIVPEDRKELLDMINAYLF